MKKINLFFILAFEEQTYKYDNIVHKLINNKKIMASTISWHYAVLGKYFNLYNFFEYKNQISQFENAIIYHIPNGRDNRDKAIEDELLNFKAKVPIVMRSYDAHSPIKMSSEYMDTYHDFVLTYITGLINNKNRLFAQLSYDMHLVVRYDKFKQNRKFACMILRKETRQEYHEDTVNFKEIEVQKIYALREKYVHFKNIDIYGYNWPLSMSNYKGALQYELKINRLNQYKFNFVIENVIVDNYISEKILDSFLALCVPVYIGSPVIEKYIPKCCFVDIRDFDSNDELVKYLENMPQKEYEIYIENIKLHRDRIFDEFSTKNNFAKPVYKWYKENYNHDLEYSENFFEEVEKDILSKKFDDGLSMKIKLKNFIKKCILYFQKVRA